MDVDKSKNGSIWQKKIKKISQKYTRGGPDVRCIVQDQGDGPDVRCIVQDQGGG